MNLLLVDKSCGDLSTFKRLLQQAGFSTHVLWSDKASKLEGQQFYSGLVLVALPEGQVNQFELMQRIRAVSAFSMAPVLFCRSCQTPDALAEILFNDGREFMPEHVSYEAAVSIISEFLLAKAA